MLIKISAASKSRLTANAVSFPARGVKNVMIAPSLTPSPPTEGIMLINVTTGIIKNMFPILTLSPSERKNRYIAVKYRHCANMDTRNDCTITPRLFL